ncbi:MAG: type III pantothenate kinase [Acidobacteria bacterium]|nr:type III pantothenate kinase [Acidobacteriota bacterium]
MLFAVDVGNTNLTLGVFRGSELVGHWRLNTDREQTVDGWGVLFRNLLSLGEISFSEIRGIAISSVAPSLDASLRRMSERYFHQTPLFVDSTTDTGLRIAIDNPTEVGADRLVNSVAAYARYGGPCVAVDFGTAINFDVISADGSYLGGLLCPGVSVAAEALFRRTARLPQVDLQPPRRLIGSNTVDALRSGLFYGSLGLLDGILARLLTELGPTTKVVGTGGQAHLLCPSSAYVQEVDEHLTLKGLRMVWERNRSPV